MTELKLILPKIFDITSNQTFTKSIFIFFIIFKLIIIIVIIIIIN